MGPIVKKADIFGRDRLMMSSFRDKNKYCCVIPKENRNKKYVKSAMLYNASVASQCSFYPTLNAKHKYKEEYFCIMHLPYSSEEKERDEVQSTFDFFIKNKKISFAFISAQALHIHNSHLLTELHFPGAELSCLSISSVSIEVLDFSHSLIRGDTRIKDCYDPQGVFLGKKIGRLSMSGSEAHGKLSIINNHIEMVLINNSSFNSPGLQLDGLSNGVSFEKTTIKKFSFTNNDCQSELNLDYTTCDLMNFENTKFFVCPSFFHANLSNQNMKIILGKRDDYDFDKAQRWYLYNKAIKPNLEWNVFKIKPIKIINKFREERNSKNRILGNQYGKFREIYNICKKKGMRIEQGDFFYLMQKALEKSKRINGCKWLFSILYRWFSNYGQSFFKPIVWLILLFFLSMFAYTAIDNDNIDKNQWYSIDMFEKLGRNAKLSFQQIAKPYSIFFMVDNQVENSAKMEGGSYLFILYFFATLESTCSMFFIAMLLLALRWNFRQT